jgi:DNA invertase Pin-like site-specific DNA recombinase
MIYGYIRVSTDRQIIENQRFEINQFCEKNVMVIGKWVEGTISGTKSVQECKLGKLLKRMKKEDILIQYSLYRYFLHLFALFRKNYLSLRLINLLKT